MKLKTINFIKSHEFWQEELTSAPYNLISIQDEHYIMLRYSQLNSDMSKDICQECRGLVIDKATLKPVALSFTKFFNYGEPGAHKINWKKAKVQEKVDGSKILCFFDKYSAEWRICTSGTLNAYNTQVGGYKMSFGELFDQAIENSGWTKENLFKHMSPKKCYTFELVSKYNRIVVPYDSPRLYLIGQRDIETFDEEMPDIPYFQKPQEYSLHTLEECINLTQTMGYDEEGFVVVDDQWHRIKVKSPAYVAAAHMLNNRVQSPARILSLILQNEEGEFLTYFPEYKEEFEQINGLLDGWVESGVYAINSWMNFKSKCPEVDKKSEALWINKWWPQYSAMLFEFGSHIKEWVKAYFKKMNKEYRLKALGIKNNEKEEKTNDDVEQ